MHHRCREQRNSRAMAHLTEGVAAPQSILVAVVLCHTDVSGALLEVKSRLHQVPILLNTQLSRTGGDGHCERVDDEPLALPQVDLHIMHSGLGNT